MLTKYVRRAASSVSAAILGGVPSLGFAPSTALANSDSHALNEAVGRGVEESKTRPLNYIFYALCKPLFVLRVYELILL